MVKALAPNCDSSTPNGRIGIEIRGGLQPYTITWEKEVIVSGTDNTTGSTASYVPIPDAKNATHLFGLESGKYKVIIESQRMDCGQNSQNAKNYYEEVITVPNRDDLYIVSGPKIDNDLCQGNPGKISIQVFNNQESELTFYYNSAIVSIFEKGTNGNYILNIPEPVAQGELLISNEEGCHISTDIQLTEIGEPSFTFHSPSLQIDNQILAREEVTFNNTSEFPYQYSQWIFGDGSSSERIFTNTTTVSPVFHTYGISGTYLATLRNYNSLGCFKETTQRIVVGKGYNILAPNGFSPNGDSINDVFRVLFNGFIRVRFSVYDSRGNILYKEEISETDPQNPVGIELVGWDGNNAKDAFNFIYQFEGFRLNDDNPILRRGTFILLR